MSAQANLPSGLATAPSGEDHAFRQLSDADRLTHLAAVIDCSHDAIFSVDRQLRVLSWNPAADQVYGYTAQEMLGRDVHCILPGAKRAELDELITKLRRNEKVASFETKRVRKDGTTFDVFLTVSPVRDCRGNFLGMSVIARDISERKAAEEQLRRKQLELEDFFENAVVGLHWVGGDGTILWANKAEMEMLGYEPHEYIGHHIAEFHANQEKIEDILCRLTRNEKLHGYETQLRCKDGSLRDVLIHSSVFFEGERFVHTRCFTMDITERRRTEEALKRTEKLAATGRFAATIAHEINNPLEAVTNLLYLAQTTPSLDQAKEFLTVAERELGRVSTIAKQTLGFFRDGAKPHAVNLREVVRSVLHMLKQKLAAKELQVVAEIEANAVIFAMEGELRQVVANLIVNAVEASEKGGRIRIRLASDARRVRLSIADEGEGISAESRKRLFEPFFTTKGAEGTGLGLWVSKQIVEKHGGTVRLRSRNSAPRQGTTFMVTLPFETQCESKARA